LVPGIVPALPAINHHAPAPAGVCHVARPDASEVRILPEPCDPSTILIVPAISSLAPGVDVPIPIDPVLEIRIYSTPLVLITSGWASVVPIKLVPGMVPALPVRDQNDPERLADKVVQVASPFVSEVRILPEPCDPSTILTAHAIVSFAVRFDPVQIPIFPLLP
jgi:hypothetical protein